jgi:predicted DsbA family dithiol-disulfide isomerase
VTGVSPPGNTRVPPGVDRVVQVEIWSDVVCPWCYIGKRRFEKALSRFEHADEVEVHWRSYELDPRAPARREGGSAEHLAAKYGLPVEVARERLAEMDRLAAVEGLDYDLAATTGGNTFDAHRLIHLGEEHGLGDAVKEALLHAYFVERVSVAEPDVLRQVGFAAGLDPAEVDDLLAGTRFADAVRADEAEATELGATGVPFFVIDRRFAVPGAQEDETFLAVLRRAWDKAHPIEVIAPPAGACEGDSCPV